LLLLITEQNMGTYISHFRNAEILVAELKGLDENAFLFGSLAPDSGIPTNDDSSPYDPPRVVTHYLAPDKDKEKIEDMRFYRQYLMRVNKDTEICRYSFLLGYFIHLICDSLWNLWVVEATIQYNRKTLEERGQEAWKLFKRDWHDLDRKYTRDHPNAIIWQAMKSLNAPPMCLAYIPPTAMSQQMDYIANIYLQPADERKLDRNYPYLNEATMDRFVHESTRATLEILSQEERLNANDHQTALYLLQPKKLRPYEYPISDTR
jgi:hypothetical protein